MKSVPLKIRLCYCIPYRSFPSIETKNLLELSIDPIVVITPADVFGDEEIIKHTYLSVQPLNTTLFSFGVTHPSGVYLELYTLCCGGAGHIHKRCGVYKKFIKCVPTDIAAFLFL